MNGSTDGRPVSPSAASPSPAPPGSTPSAAMALPFAHGPVNGDLLEYLNEVNIVCGSSLLVFDTYSCCNLSHVGWGSARVPGRGKPLRFKGLRAPGFAWCMGHCF